MAKGVWGRVITLIILWVSLRAYLKRLILVPSSHCGYWTLILCAVTLEPLIHRCVDRTKVMAALFLTYLRVIK